MTDPTILSFTTSNRGKRMLIYSGYVYRLKKSTKNVKYWVCQSNSCAANVHTNASDQFVKANGQHQHLPAPERIELRDLKNKAKERVRTEATSVPKIYEEELARSNISSAALILAPLPADAKSVLNRVRRKITPPIPTSSDFDIPDVYRQTLTGKPFVCTDRFIRNKRMILFATDQQLETLFSSEWIFLDGTFDACPSQFKQLYTIHSLKFKQNFPCVISLLSGKSTDIYLQLFSELECHAERLNLKFEPRHVMSDFEMSLIKAVKQKFPMVMRHGCYFHYCQSLYKQVQLLGLGTAYFEDESTRLSCRSTMALALLPIELIEEAVQLLEDDSLPEMKDFFKYFKYQWSTRVPPKYWNVSTLEFRTNNFAEGWHNKFSNRVDKTHPNVWRLFGCLQLEELSFRQQLGKVNCAMQKKKNDTGCFIRTQITTLTERHEKKEITLLEFIHGLSMIVAQNSTIAH
ncbi:unnamed protein product [Rotaria magnacalcarata]|uniref:MULE transposase domain-containing protein n=3 Tax=Rotaria magnacalcarata TaxID=392030 RepID=A0A816GY33_9BILA|nr:unnamed protein product [Rotaria magnacalcarata]CAF1678873.1 unnamed protein product [Rotaria magnacalcarata]CAF4558151.1 unnamed protein product [Rotaria magnacalcarata]